MAKIRSYTTIEQSKVLAEILPLESADMFWLVLGNTPRVHVLTEPLSNYSQWESYPCWSLAALLDLLPNNEHIETTISRGGWKIDTFEYVPNIWWCEYENTENQTKFNISADNPIDACYEMIIKLDEQKLL